jgi:hypothetical protein
MMSLVIVVSVQVVLRVSVVVVGHGQPGGAGVGDAGRLPARCVSASGLPRTRQAA